MAGLRGRKPQLQGDARLAIKWAHQYFTAPEPTYPIDVSKGITDWGMLGNGPDPSLTNPPAGVDPNRGVGDCGVAAYEHERMLGGATVDANDTVALYWQYDNGQDQGVVLADFLLWLYQKQLIAGFAPVELSSVDRVMATLGRGVYVGVNLTDDADQLFDQRLPWTTSAGQTPDPNEGHCILKVTQSAAGADGKFVTWGALQDADGPWQSACVEEAWVMLTADDLDEPNYAQLKADLDALPNVTDGPPPSPGPAPDPTPPVPDPPLPPDPPEPPEPPVDPILDLLEDVVHDHLVPHPVKRWAMMVTERLVQG